MKKRKCNYGGSIDDTLNSLVMPTLNMAASGSTFGPVGTIAGAAIGLGTALKNKRDLQNTVVFGSPGAYNYGGDIFEVPGDPSKIDSKRYNYKGKEIYLTPSETVDLNNDFVYTSAVRNPVTGNKFSKDGKNLANIISNNSKKNTLYADKIAANTANVTEAFADSLKALQTLATSPKNNNRYYQGGPIQREYIDENGMPVLLDDGEMFDQNGMVVYAPFDFTTGKYDLSGDFHWKYGSNVQKNPIINQSTVNNTGKGKTSVKNNPKIPLDNNTLSFQKWYNQKIAAPAGLAPIKEDGIAGKITKPLMDKYKNWSNPNVRFAPANMPANMPTEVPQELTAYQKMKELPSLNTKENLTPQRVLTNSNNPLSGATLSTAESSSNQVGPNGVSYSGDLYQKIAPALQGLQFIGGPEKETANLNTTPITKEVYDPTSQLYQSNRTFNNRVSGVDGVSSNFRRAIENALYAQKLNQDSEILQRYDQMNQGANTSYEQRLSQRRSENIGQINLTNDINARNRAAFDNGINTSLQTLSNYGRALNDKTYADRILDILKILNPDGFKSYSNG